MQQVLVGGGFFFGRMFDGGIRDSFIFLEDFSELWVVGEALVAF